MVYQSKPSLVNIWWLSLQAMNPKHSGEHALFWGSVAFLRMDFDPNKNCWKPKSTFSWWFLLNDFSGKKVATFIDRGQNPPVSWHSTPKGKVRLSRGPIYAAMPNLNDIKSLYNSLAQMKELLNKCSNCNIHHVLGFDLSAFSTEKVERPLRPRHFDHMDLWPRFDVKRLIGRRFKDSTVQKASGFGQRTWEMDCRRLL